MSWANLSSGRFGEVSFDRAALIAADLTDAMFVQASFNGAYLGEAILTGANFEYATLERVDLRGAIGANLRGASLSYAILPDGRVVTESTKGIERKYFLS